MSCPRKGLRHQRPKRMHAIPSPESKRDHALARVAQWTERRPANQKVASLIPIQGTCLGCMRGNHTLICLSLSFALPPPLSKSK